MYKIQSILFDKHKYNIRKATMFLKNNHYKHNKVDETTNFYRFRQINPQILKRDGYKKIITKTIASGIEFIIYYK